MTVRSRPWILAISSCVCILLLVGCGDDSGNCEPAVDAAVGPDAAQPENATFIVVSWDDEAEDWISVENALVAFDVPGGDRLERMTDADGKVIFVGMSWGRGAGAVTAYRFGFSMFSAVNLDATRYSEAFAVDGAMALPVFDLDPTPDPGTVTITGTATGLDPSHRYYVNVGGSLNATEWVGYANDTFVVEGPRNEPFTIQAFSHEYNTVPSVQGFDQPIYSVVNVDIAATTTHQTVELDFANASVTTYTADSWMDLPTRPDSPLRRGVAATCVLDTSSALCGGWPTHVDISGDGNRFDVSYLWAEPSYLEAFTTLFQVYWSYAYSRVVLDGPPEAGSLGALRDLPRWIAPSDPSDLHFLKAPIQWELFESDVPETMLSLNRRGQTIWNVSAGPNATSLTIPEPHSTVDLEQVLGEDPIRTWLVTGELDWTSMRWTWQTQNLPIELVP